MSAAITFDQPRVRIPPTQASYFEAYLSPDGIVVEVYVTEEDFRASRQQRVVAAASDTAEPEIQICRVELFQTVQPTASKRRPVC